MDIDLIDVGNVNVGQHKAIMDDGDDDSNVGGKKNARGHSLVQDEVGVAPEPHVGMEFYSEHAALIFYEEYARHIGFRTHVSHTNRSKGDGRSTSREFLCARDQSRKRASEKCEAMLRIEERGQDKWVVAKFVKGHSHSVTGPNKGHSIRPQKHSNATAKDVMETDQSGDVIPSGTMCVSSIDGNHVPPEMNHGGENMRPESNRTNKNFGLSVCYARHPSQKRSLGKDSQNLLDYFKKMQAENPGFYYAIQLDEENRVANVFWADARSRTAYSHFGDAVVVDTICIINQYKVPIAPFTGFNHHGQTILFGCALLFDESDAAFVWLFKTFLAAMNDRAPVSVTTAKGRIIQTAVARVFPEARHCLNRWHVLREGQDKMAHVCVAHPNFQVDLYDCLNLTETIEEFESIWASILDKYDLKRNDWLQSIYDSRRQWVPAYYRDFFFAAIFPHQQFQSFFDGYVNQQTTLPLFFRQYESALESSFERELEADFDTICTTPLLKTPSPMEKQAANLYTKRIFLKFQEELVETFAYTASRIDGDGENDTYRVAKFEDDYKAYFVALNISEKKASCSCHMFDYSGILCRHILTVFTVTNILTLPSHYILKRWTRNAKDGASFEEHFERQGQESLTKRFNNLCKEAIRYAETGAITSETYSLALTSLREGGQKVACVRKNVAKVVRPCSQVSRGNNDEWRASKLSGDMTPSLWPQQDEIIHHFNLNDAGAAGQPIIQKNVSHMTPISLNRDESYSDNVVVLPCLKSMTWVMENKNLTPEDRVAVINLKLQDYSTSPTGESVVKFSLSKIALEPMLRSMAYISEQLSTSANKVAVINLKLQDAEMISGESEVKFQVSRDALGAMLRSMAYIREQLCNRVEPKQDNAAKRQRKI